MDQACRLTIWSTISLCSVALMSLATPRWNSNATSQTHFERKHLNAITKLVLEVQKRCPL